MIVDSFPTVHKVYQIICERLNKNCPTDFNDFKKVYGHRSSEFMRNMGYSEEEVILHNKMYSELILKQNPLFFKNIGPVIKKLSEQYKLILVTSSNKSEVDQKLTRLGVISLFQEVHGGESGKGSILKVEILKQILTNHHLENHEVLMIGDRINDYNDAKKAGIDNVILVEYGWGYDPKNIPEYKSRYLVKEPRDLLEAVKRF